MCQCIFEHVNVPNDACALVFFVPRAVGPEVLERMRQGGEAWRKANPSVPPCIIVPNDCEVQVIVPDADGKLTTITPSPFQRIITEEEAKMLFGEGIQLSVEASEQAVPCDESDMCS